MKVPFIFFVDYGPRSNLLRCLVYSGYSIAAFACLIANFETFWVVLKASIIGPLPLSPPLSLSLQRPSEPEPIFCKLQVQLLHPKVRHITLDTFTF